MDAKRFDIIAEADARILEPGTSVVLAPGGHVTPLAADTLRARRITVVRDDVASVDAEALVPAAAIRRVALGSDHVGIGLKRHLLAHLRGAGLAVAEFGAVDETPLDYPDVAASVGRAVARGEADAGIVIDGAGLGSTIAANKIAGVRAAMCPDERLARYAREHNGANVLALGATILTLADATRIVDTWLVTPMKEPRYIRRLAKIAQLERTRP